MERKTVTKLHFKMYKSGKRWIVAGLLSSAILTTMAISNISVKADTSNDGFQIAQQQDTKLNNNDTNAQNNQNQQTKLTNPQSQDNTNINTNQNDTAFTNDPTKTTTNQTTNQPATNQTTTTPNTNTATNGTTTTPTSSSSNNSSASSSASVNSSSAASSSASSQSISDAAKSALGNPVMFSGSNYYLDSNDRVYKSTLISKNGQLFYFDQNGQLQDLSNIQPTLGTTTTSANPKIAAANPKEISNVDGFLTASSWYQPKQIQDNGTTWRKSTKKDLRPVISVWWPNKQVQVNYINYMSKLGLSNVNATLAMNQKNLNAAADDIRKNIEQKISATHSAKWLRNSMKDFVKTQSEWNLTSEGYSVSDGFQGGSVLYQNSKLTPYSNSAYRLLNRTPSRQTGTEKYPYSYYGYELLLANDVDNSNPVVQSEDLNWLYYLLHIGSITKQGSNANFDSIRVDAVDNMDADVLNIASKYMDKIYKTSASEKNANNHISILEDWSKNDPHYLKDHNSNQITIDSRFRDALDDSLFGDPTQRKSLTELIKGLVDRSTDYTQNKANPNYSMVRAHDNGVQESIAKIITDHIDPTSNGYILTQDQLNKAFAIYDNDQQQTNKQYTQYNIPSSYALMLTNKDTIPRIYYGDMFTDDGQFMQTKTPYFDALSTMMKARIQYVSGGQQMNVQKVSNGNDEVLTSVRFGKNALNPNATGNKMTRTSGIGVVEANNPNLQLGANDQIVLNMGAAHKNQEYRPLINPNSQGLSMYNTDNDTNVRLKTNAQGQLILNQSQIQGFSNPQLSGYLSMWVPVGANANQDVRTKPSKQKNANGRIINSNAALDSNLIFEGFSNFQAQPTKRSQYENVVLPKQTQFFKNLGVTYMQLPPQYRSVGGDSFLDATVKNGYAFNDRYDLGYNTPTKYGTIKDLTNTIKALHKSNIKVMADFVPDQLYSLPNQQVVNAYKADRLGHKLGGSAIYNNLYLTNSLGSGKDYQAKFGGKYLTMLKKQYPSLFNTKQISNGQTLPTNVKLKQWSGKYLNGSNIQGTGAYNVLSNLNNQGYFTVPNSQNKNLKVFLPQVLNGKAYTTGLKQNGNKIQYLTSSGYVGTNGFYNDPNGYSYYFDGNGNMVTQPTTINNGKFYFLNNGINLKNFIDTTNNQLTYYSPNGSIEQTPGYYTIDQTNYFYVNKNGQLLTGLNTLPGGLVQYFDNDGVQVKGKIITTQNGSLYLDPSSGSAVQNQFVQVNGHTYYAGANGYFLTGQQVIDNQNYNFDQTGVQISNTNNVKSV